MTSEIDAKTPTMLNAMNALRLILTFGSIALAVTAHAQVSAKTWRIGYIGNTATPAPETSYMAEAFRKRLEEHGYTEGKNLVIERRYIEGKIDRFPQFAAEFVRLNVDAIVVGPPPGVRAAMQATKVIPIIMNGANDPIENGFVASLGHPGGNVTGIADLKLDLVPKRLELLKAAVPRISRVAYLRGNFSGLDSTQLTTLINRQDAAAQTLGVRILRVQLNTPQDLNDAITTVARERPDALLISPSPTNFILRRELAEFAVRQRLPTIASSREEAVAGALMSYGPSHADQFRSLADYIDRIFKGANAGDIPVAQPTKFELVINLNTAKALGISIPSSFLLRADEVLR